MSDMSFEPLGGGCKCGAVRLVLAGVPIITHRCHCRDRQQMSGAAFRINFMIERDRLTVTRGEPVMLEAHDGRKMRCGICQYPLWGYHRLFGEAIAFVAAGLLDAAERLAPEVHFFTRSKHPWIRLPAGMPAFDTLGGPGKAGYRERIEAALRSAGLAPP